MILFIQIPAIATTFQISMEIAASLNPKNLPCSSQPLDWNSVIRQQAKLRNDAAILATYSQMRLLGDFPNSSTLPLVFKACGNLDAVEIGREIHRNVRTANLIKDVRVGTSLIGFYCKCGCLGEAFSVFDEMSERDVVAWNALISGCVELMEYEEAFFCFMDMQTEGLRPNARTVVTMLIAAGEMRDLRLGKELHGYCLRNELLESSAHVVTALIGFYSKFDLVLAEYVFGLVELGNIVIWNAMINGYFEAGKLFEALCLFVQLLVNGAGFDLVTVLVVVQACGEYSCCKLGKQVHQLVIKCGFDQDLRIVDALMNMYSGIGLTDFARILFSSVSARDAALWNSLLCAYIESDRIDEAIDIFRIMHSPGIKHDERTLCIALSLCESSSDGLRNGRSLQAYAIKSGIEDHATIKSALLSLYGEFNSVESAIKIFNEGAFPDVLSWNMLILALARNGLRYQALDFFVQMVYTRVALNCHTIIAILAACNDESYLNLGRSIHGHAIKLGIIIDLPLHTVLTEMYLNCNSEPTSKLLFESFPEKDLISWNAMIASYTNNNEAEKALLLLRDLVHQMEPNAVTIINALSSCTDLANCPAGKCIHAYATRRLFHSDLPVANALITMYARCGSLNYAENIFIHSTKRNLVSWNAMIACYGIHGQGHDALTAFSKLQQQGFVPVKITFVSVLSACSHSGLIEEGLHLYQKMIHDFEITPEAVHYACVVDLLARGGRFEEAWAFITSMPIPPIASAWRALLGACRVYSETKYASSAFQKLIELEPTNPGNYILLSNIFAAAGEWSEVETLRKTLHEKGLRKPPGRSWIVTRNEIHYFTAGDKSHPQCHEIYTKLNALLASCRETGYVPDVSWVLHDEEEEKRIERLSSHSEKLAVAFGLIRVGRSTRIIIGKNLRMCGDCHEFMKHVSRLAGREIVVRDGIRFHHFNNGVCSCKDYW